MRGVDCLAEIPHKSLHRPATRSILRPFSYEQSYSLTSFQVSQRKAMEIKAAKALEFLLEKGVTHLHHANTVITSCSFLRRRELVSRGIMDHLGLNQTVQSSDDNDKACGVYFDIFLDSVDIHARAKRRNIYGPVLFKLSVEKMLKLKLPPIWITRSNPMYWSNMIKHSERWFVNFNELREDFVVGRFNQMVVLRHMGGILPIHSCLDEVVLDDPEMKHGSIDFYSLSLGALKLAVAEAKKEWTVKFKKRRCQSKCACTDEYPEDKDTTMELYVPHRTDT